MVYVWQKPPIIALYMYISCHSLCIILYRNFILFKTICNAFKVLVPSLPWASRLVHCNILYLTYIHNTMLAICDQIWENPPYGIFSKNQA